MDRKKTKYLVGENALIERRSDEELALRLVRGIGVG